VGLGKGTNTLAYSNDGIHWSGLGNSIFKTVGFQAARGRGTFVAVGQGVNTIAHSRDGITWTPVKNSSSIFSGSGNAVAWGRNKFVAVGHGTNAIVYSENGIEWQTALAADQLSGLALAVNPVNGEFLVVGNYNKIAWSSDGKDWIVRTGPFAYNFGVAYGEGKFVVMGEDSTATSTDGGETWSESKFPGPDFSKGNGKGMAYGNRRFVAVGQWEATWVVYSDDGENWTKAPEDSQAVFTGKYGMGWGFGVVWAGNKFVALGGDGTPGPSVACSPDGVNWLPSAGSQNLFSEGGFGGGWGFHG